jgi:hypothetical protein
MKKFGLLAVLIAIFSLFVSAQTNKKAEIKRIDAYVKTVDAFVKKNKSPHLVFADVSDYETDSKAKWRKFSSEKALEKFRETTETYTIAYNWKRNGKIIRSSFTLFSPSGDWAKYVHFYFREDGTLAKSETEMRTFVGDFAAQRDFYFDRKGRLLKKTIEYKDLDGKPKQVAEDDLQNNLFFLGKENYYKKTSRLPFASLLKRKRN